MEITHAKPKPERTPRGTITDLYYYPIRGLSAQRLDSVTVAPDRGFPLDRCWALAKRSGPDAAGPAGPTSSAQAYGLTRDPRLSGVVTCFDPDTERLVVGVRGHTVLDCSLSDEAGREEAENLFARVLDLDPDDRPRLVRRPSADANFAYTASVSRSLTWACHLVNLATVRELEERIGHPVDPMRFRANLYVDLGEPWIERDLLGRTLRAGTVLMRGEMATARCAATEVNLDTTERDLPIPRLLMQHFGHVDVGIYANILSAGELRPGMPVHALDDEALVADGASR